LQIKDRLHFVLWQFNRQRRHSLQPISPLPEASSASIWRFSPETQEARK
jgi:hypothetical protein